MVIKKVRERKEAPCILHITNDYSGSTVYSNLVKELDRIGLKQIIYNPIREKRRVGKNKITFETKGSKIIYRPILNYTSDRVFYPLKIKKLINDIQSLIDIKQIDFIHAHTWYSDGGIAYLLAKKYHIPYIVTIRSTDLHSFQTKQFYLRPFGKKILEYAQRVVLITASYTNQILNLPSLKAIKKDLHKKLQIIPNGVDKFWIQNSKGKVSLPLKKRINILYVGTFIKRKNTILLQKAVTEIKNEKGSNIHLYLVGGGGSYEQEIIRNCEKDPKLFTYLKKVTTRKELIEIYSQCSIFAMPSNNETFGLVYIEALLNGLPILYTKGQGIDGLYEEKIGEKISKFSVYEIKDKLLNLINHHESYEIPTGKIKKQHDWQLIAEKYLNIYRPYL